MDIPLKLTIARMQQAATAQEAESLRLQIEGALLPNQVLQEGADELAALTLRGLAGASPAGRAESWALLSQLAAGAVPLTAAEPEVVSASQAVVGESLSAALDRAAAPVADPADFWAVDVLDAALNFVTPTLQREIRIGLQQFASRGEVERRVVDVILREYPSLLVDEPDDGRWPRR